MINIEYFNTVFILAVAFLISFIIFLLSQFLIFQDKDLEKLSPYECGFQPFEDARQKFDIHFYLVAILFIIFDLEIMYLFPWSIALPILNYFSFFSMWFFLLLLTIGFIYEWKKGALEWRSL